MSTAAMAMASPEDKAGQAFESGDNSTTPNAQHTRTYQACIPCRRRKVRCDLGPVDNPHEPPCVRCRREAKECFFSATRRKKRAADSGAGPEDVEPDDYEVRGGRKRLKEGTNGPGSDFGSFDAAVGASQSPAPFLAQPLAQPLTPGGSLGRRQPLRRPDIPINGFGDSENEEQVNNHTAAMLQTAELHHGHDALNVLLAAAQQHPHSHSDTKQSVTFEPYATSTVSPATVQHPSPEMRQKIPRHQSSHSIDPSIMPTEDDNAAALRAWSRFRFVRSGWFSAQEGMKYIDYFYTYLSPLTPIALPDYRHPSRHIALLENEPLLAVTMLMISSRYTMLNESVGRSYALHQRLWDYTQRMIDRLLWGRELPGMNALPGDAGCDVNPLSRKGLLTLGTVESLMLLTEWHSRHVHFPADEDDTELMVPEDGNSTGNFTTARERSNRDWLEPCYRSDRMVWKLLNMAMTVALEIGVFDNDSSRHAKVMSKDQAALYAQRRMHVKSLLLVYITQTSGRLGIAAMLPEGYADPSLSELYSPKTRDLFRDIRDVVVHYWLQLAHLVKMGNLQLYANRQYTREIIRSGKYKALLQTINPLLTKWRQEVDGYRTEIPPQMYHIMMVEYEHSRVCVNQLALQAVLERCINNNTTDGDSGRVLPPGRLDQWYADDRESVGHVIDACRNVLKIVVDGLAPGGFLKHAPVRTSFRMISVSMVLLKTFAFGAHTKDMNASLSLMHRTVTALRENVVDDVHIANGFARKIEFLVDRIPKALKRFPGSGQGNSRGASASRGVSRSPAPQGLYASQRPDNGQARDAASSEHQWPFSGIGTVNNVQGNGQDGSSHPLDGYDFNDNGDNFMLMPPPNNMGHNSMSGAGDYGSYGGGYSGNGFGFGQDGFGDQGWVALPLDNIFGGQNVQQTGFGPTIDGDDMLDVLLRGSVNV